MKDYIVLIGFVVLGIALFLIIVGMKGGFAGQFGGVNNMLDAL